jgi:hypothetical protein
MKPLQQIRAATKEQLEFYGLTIGTVVTTNDPQQLGRARVLCPHLGDRIEMTVEDIPWALYWSPSFGGAGGASHGMWMLPKPGTHVLVGCIDGDTNHRIYIGCVVSTMALNTANTLPHGRFTYTASGGDGPLNSKGMPLEPNYSKQTEAYGPRENNFEWRTRGADFTVAALDTSAVTNSDSPKPDDKDVPFTRAES